MRLFFGCVLTGLSPFVVWINVVEGDWGDVAIAGMLFLFGVVTLAMRDGEWQG